MAGRHAVEAGDGGVFREHGFGAELEGLSLLADAQRAGGRGDARVDEVP